MTAQKPKDLSASVRQRLLNYAQKANVDFQVVLAQFGFERLLYRLSQSKHAGQFTVKGAMMFLVWAGMLVQNNNFRTYKIINNTAPSLSFRWTRPHPLPRERTEVRGHICQHSPHPNPLPREREYYFGHQWWAGEQYRPTIDLDLTALREHSGNELKTIFQDIRSLAVEDDGLVFLSTPVRVESIRADAEYGGLRVTLEARLGQSRIPLQVDIGFGDAITPKARIEEFPALLDFPAPHLPMYPKETSIAEKYETMVRRGIINSRMKDYYDVWVLAKQFDYDGEILKNAIRATFLRRKTVLPEEVPDGLSEGFAKDKTKQNQWNAFVRRTRLKLPCKDINIIVAELSIFLVPPSVAACQSKTFDKTWRKGGPWR